MSTENEIEIVSSQLLQAEAITASSEKKVTITCKTCEVTINDDQTKLICTNQKCGVTTCNACINLMFKMMFAQPALNYPLTCGSCVNPFNTTDIDRILTNHQHYEQFIACVLPLYWSDHCLEKNEQLAQCPFCPYVEIHTTDACPVRFLTCQHPSCGQRSCLICLHPIENDNDELIHRSRCIELHSYKEMVEKAIESGSQQHCPYCQLQGLKDDGCTHMTCERCGLTWCYLCGMKEEECLVEDDADQSLSAHNQDWEQHKGRCPMSLVSIHELDDRWPDTDQGCLEYFHRYRTLCQLYDVLEIVGEDKLDELNDNFGIIDASGYTIEEIKDYQSRVLINYSSTNDDD